MTKEEHISFIVVLVICIGILALDKWLNRKDDK